MKTLEDGQEEPTPVQSPQEQPEDNTENSSQKAEEMEWISLIVEKGDHRAFQKLYERHAPAIFRRLYRLIGDKTQAEDASQQVFLEAHRSLHNFRGEGNLSSWLHRIAGRVAVQTYKKQWRSRSLIERLGLFQKSVSPQHFGNQEAAYIRQEIQKWTRHFVDRLAPEKRSVLMFCDFEGMTLEEVGEQLGIPKGTVASRLHHARNQIKGMVERELKRQGLSWGEIIDAQ